MQAPASLARAAARWRRVRATHSRPPAPLLY
jgi:hypothetical protein